MTLLRQSGFWSRFSGSILIPQDTAHPGRLTSIFLLPPAKPPFAIAISFSITFLSFPFLGNVSPYVHANVSLSDPPLHNRNEQSGNFSKILDAINRSDVPPWQPGLRLLRFLRRVHGSHLLRICSRFARRLPRDWRERKAESRVGLRKPKVGWMGK